MPASQCKSEARSSLFDPFITPNTLASYIKLNNIRADYILITHGHADHIADAVQIARRMEAGETSYYSGDTALTSDMRFIGEEFELRFAVLPIGDNFTMGAKDAAKAAGLVKCNQVVGVHYDTFPPIKIDHAEAAATFAQAGVKLHLVPIGGSVDL